MVIQVPFLPFLFSIFKVTTCNFYMTSTIKLRLWANRFPKQEIPPQTHAIGWASVAMLRHSNKQSNVENAAQPHFLSFFFFVEKVNQYKLLGQEITHSSYKSLSKYTRIRDWCSINHYWDSVLLLGFFHTEITHICTLNV